MAEVKNVKLNVSSNIKDVSTDAKGLNKNLSTATSGANDLSSKTNAVGKSSGGIGALSGTLGKLSPALAGANAAAGGLLKTMWALVANPIGAVIAAVVLSLTALYKAFSSTKAGGEQLKQIMSGIGAAIDVLRDRVLKIGGAIVKFFSGDLKGAFSDAKAAVSGIGSEIEKEFKQAAKAKKYLQEVTDSVRQLSVSRAKLDRDLARSKEIINDENASYAEKKKAIEEVKKAEEKQTAQELKNAEKKLKAIKLANSLSDTDAENLDKQAAAEAELYALQQKSADDKRAIAKTEKRADNEEKSRVKELATARAAAAKERLDQQKANDKAREDSLKKIADLEQSYTDSLMSAKDLEILNVTRKYEEQIKLAEKYGQSTVKLKEAEAYEKQKIDKKYEDEKLKIIENAQKEVEKLELQRVNDYLQSIEDLQEANYQAGLTEQQREITAVNDKYFALETAAIGNAEQLATIAEAKNRELNTIEEKALEKQKQIDKQKRDSQIQSVQNTLSTIGSLTELFAGKSRKEQEKAFKVQKAVNVASTLVETYLGAQKAYTSQIIPLDPTSVVRGALAAAAVIAAGLANVKKISSTQFSGSSASGDTSAPSVSSPVGTQAQAPSFNVVGNSGINQLAQVNQQPVQAYVVSSAVTTAQSLDRNRIENATIG
jgi:hypothetical protein